eukprot:3076870-Lingulodinium_polyedra.AAC.1
MGHGEERWQKWNDLGAHLKTAAHDALKVNAQHGVIEVTELGKQNFNAPNVGGARWRTDAHHARDGCE